MQQQSLKGLHDLSVFSFYSNTRTCVAMEVGICWDLKNQQVLPIRSQTFLVSSMNKTSALEAEQTVHSIWLLWGTLKNLMPVSLLPGIHMLLFCHDENKTVYKTETSYFLEKLWVPVQTFAIKRSFTTPASHKTWESCWIYGIAEWAPFIHIVSHFPQA